MNKKKWFTETRHVDCETGEALSESRVKREGWLKTGSSSTVTDCGMYNLKVFTNEYEKNRQVRIEF